MYVVYIIIRPPMFLCSKGAVVERRVVCVGREEDGLRRTGERRRICRWLTRSRLSGKREDVFVS